MKAPELREYTVVLMKLYRDTASAALRDLLAHWMVLPALIGAYFLFMLVANGLSATGPAAGFILGLLSTALISWYYALVHHSTTERRTGFQDLAQFDWQMFSLVLNAGFVFWIAAMLVNAFATSLNSPWLMLCLNLGIVMLFNALPEVIHVRRSYGLSALNEAFSYTREQWIEWFLPLFLLALPLIIIDPVLVVINLARSSPLLPPYFVLLCASSLAQNFSSYLVLIAGLLCAHWFMLFRARLYPMLDSGTRRHRLYKAKQR